MSQVVLEGVTKRFGDVVAVEAVDLEVVDGEFMVLLGPSGCGKTTALRLVAGLETLTEGTVRIGDRVVNNIEAKDRNVSMVFQSYALYPHMTVHKNIESPLIARSFSVDGGPPRKLTREERTERIAEAELILGLTDLDGRKPRALSGGQRQRVALARAIVGRPEVFLFDEPLSNLDAKLRAQTRVELVDLHRRLGSTFLYVTHDQVEAMTMATRIAILDAGRLQQVGPPQDVYDRPENLFVARFIGSPPMNTLEGRVAAGEGGFAVVVGEGQLPLDGTPPEGIGDGSPIVVGVRPEDLGVADQGLHAIVEAVEWLGHERHVICHVEDQPVVVRQPADDAAPSIGSTIALVAEPERLHLFDPVSSERVS